MDPNSPTPTRRRLEEDEEVFSDANQAPLSEQFDLDHANMEKVGEVMERICKIFEDPDMEYAQVVKSIARLALFLYHTLDGYNAEYASAIFQDFTRKNTLLINRGLDGQDAENMTAIGDGPRNLFPSAPGSQKSGTSFDFKDVDTSTKKKSVTFEGKSTNKKRKRSAPKGGNSSSSYSDESDSAEPAGERSSKRYPLRQKRPMATTPSKTSALPAARKKPPKGLGTEYLVEELASEGTGRLSLLVKEDNVIALGPKTSKAKVVGQTKELMKRLRGIQNDPTKTESRIEKDFPKNIVQLLMTQVFHPSALARVNNILDDYLRPDPDTGISAQMVKQFEKASDAPWPDQVKELLHSTAVVVNHASNAGEAYKGYKNLVEKHDLVAKYLDISEQLENESGEEAQGSLRYYFRIHGYAPDQGQAWRTKVLDLLSDVGVNDENKKALRSVINISRPIYFFAHHFGGLGVLLLAPKNLQTILANQCGGTTKCVEAYKIVKETFPELEEIGKWMTDNVAYALREGESPLIPRFQINADNHPVNPDASLVEVLAEAFPYAGK